MGRNLDYVKRARRLSEKIAPKDQIDCIAIVSSPNLKYFFNYAGESYERFCCGLLSKDGEKSALVVPRLDLAKAEKGSAQNIYPWNDSEGYTQALERAMEGIDSKGSVIGSELSISMGQMDSFKSAIGTSNFVGISEEISLLRLVKDEEESKSIRKTSRLLERAYRKIPELLGVGRSELEVGEEIRRFLLQNGAGSADFIAVQSGKNSAIPHSLVTKKKLRKGDIIVIDISCTNAEGYFADFTRTFSLGKPSEKQSEVYQIVKDAQRAACRAVRVGALAREIDIAAREVITRSGYGEYFFTRTGHGLGLEVHEKPWMRGDNEQELERGMVFTVEPGIYLPGKFGIRIEDDLLMEKKNASSLTRLSHDLIIA